MSDVVPLHSHITQIWVLYRGISKTHSVIKEKEKVKPIQYMSRD
jgi:hypothetical protein